MGFPKGSIQDKRTRLWVYPCFMRPGKHYFMIRLDPQSDGSNFANSQLRKFTEGSSTPIRAGTPNTGGSGFQKLVANLDEDTS